MSIAGATVAITANAAGSIRLPQEGVDRVVLANASPFLVTLTIGARQDYLLPGEKNLFRTAGSASPVGYQCQAVGNTVPISPSGILIPVWYFPGEPIPGSALPVILPPQAPTGTRLSATFTVAGGVETGTLLPAPAAGMAYQLSAIVINSPTSLASGTLTSPGGVTYAAWPGTEQGALVIPPVVVATAVVITVANAANGATFTLQYDSVSA